MSPTSKLNKALLAKIEKLSTPEEKMNLFLQELQGSGSIKSDFATEYLSILVEIMEGAEEDDTETLQEKANRVQTLITYLDTAILGKTEKKKLTEASNKVHKQLKSTASKKRDIRSKAAGIIDRLSDNAESIAGFAFANDPLMNLLGKGAGKAGGFVADKLRNSFRSNKSAGRKALKGDAQSLLGKATRKPKGGGAGGAGPGEEEGSFDEGLGAGGGASGGEITKAMVKLTQKIATDTQTILSTTSHLTKPIKDIASNMQEVMNVMVKEMMMRLKATGQSTSGALNAIAGKGNGKGGSDGGFGIFDYVKSLAAKKVLGATWRGSKALVKKGWSSSTSLLKKLPKNPRMLALTAVLATAAGATAYMTSGDDDDEGGDNPDAEGVEEEDNSIWGVVKSTVGRIMKVMGGAIGLILGPIGNIIGYLMTGLASIFSLSKLYGFVKKIGTFVIDTLWWGIKKMFQGVMWLAKTQLAIMTYGAKVLYSGACFLYEGIVAAWKATTEFLSRSWKWLSDTASWAWEKITSTIGSVWTGLTGLISGGWETAKSWFSSGWGLMKDTFGSVMSFLGDSWDGAKTTLLTGVATVKDLGGKLIDPIAEGLSFISDTFEGVFGTFWGWIKSSASWLGSWFSDDMPDKEDITIESTPEGEIQRIAESGVTNEYDNATGTNVEASGPNPIKRIVSGGKGYLVVERPDGSIEKLTGALNWRSNNPGNLEYGDFARKMGAIGATGDNNRFAVFPNYEAGLAAQRKLIFESDSYRNLTLQQMIYKYAPPKENNTRAYFNKLLGATHGSNIRMGQYSTEQQNAILAASHKQEGFRPGKAEQLSPASQLGPGSTTAGAATPQMQQLGAAAAADADQVVMFKEGDTTVVDISRQVMPAAAGPGPGPSTNSSR